MIIHLIDGTYELFRHFYGLRTFNKGKDKPFGAAAGVLNGILQMIDEGATHIGVATDHVIESFRNDLWADYKTGAGVERALLTQFHPLEEALGRRAFLAGLGLAEVLQQFALLGRQFGRRFDQDSRHQVASPAAVEDTHAGAAMTQCFARLDSGGNLDLDLVAVDARNRD